MSLPGRVILRQYEGSQKTHSEFSFLFAWVLGNCSVAAQSAPGDEHWDYRFGLPGVDGAILAIAVQGNADVHRGKFMHLLREHSGH